MQKKQLSQEFKIRAANDNDMAGLLRVENTCFNDPAYEILDEELFSEFLDAQKDGHGVIMLVAEFKKGAIGGYILATSFMPEGDGLNLLEDNYYIDSLAVLPEYRKAGVAGAMMRALETDVAPDAANDNFTTARLHAHVLEGNAPSRALFKSCDWEEGEVLPDYYDAGKNGLVMSKDL